MFQHQPQARGPLSGSRHLLRVVAPVACAVTLLGLTAAPSSARQDAGQPSARQGHVAECGLARVGTQYVHCDFLTGNGVPAPSWVPER